MQTHLSPKDLASIVGVSESSLKRWVDDGRLRAERTSGGHRRVPVAEAVRFIRETAAEIVEPSLLGIAELSASVLANTRRQGVERALMAAVGGGRADEVVGIVLLAFLQSRVVGSVCDGPMAVGLVHAPEPGAAHSSQNGARAHPPAEAMHRATRIMAQLLPHPGQSGPRAVVRTIGADAALVSEMAALALQERGYRTIVEGIGSDAGESFGSGDRVLCLAIGAGAVPRPEQLAEARALGAETIVCGPGAWGLDRRHGVRPVRSMCELGSLAATLLSGSAVDSISPGGKVRAAQAVQN